jgi:hypothetical protein
MDKEIVLMDYTYTGITGGRYHPSYKEGKWYLMPGSAPVSFLWIVTLCNIPEDEALIIKLKYGC